MKQNYQLLMEQEIEKNIKLNKKPTLLLHCCCAPCSSYVLETINNYFDITVLYYNPNISPVEEFNKRYNELKKLVKETNLEDKIKFLEVEYNNEEFEEIAKGLENEPEGGARCTKCYYLRLEMTARIAKEHNFDYFTTTLSISPYKDAEKLNKIGEVLEKKYNIKHLYADFKKKNGYKRSIELSKIYGLYRQDYCGCRFSKEERDKRVGSNEE